MGGYPAPHAAVAELKGGGALPFEMKVWTSKYSNNLVEQDHRRVKQRIYSMLGFKSFASAAVTISGIELVQKIRKVQFDTSAVITREEGRVSHVWEAVLAG